MRLLDRYLLRELLLPLSYCVIGLLLIWEVLDLMLRSETFQLNKLHGGDIVLYYLTQTPEVLVTVLPVALLLALLYALSNHARYNEITAMRAAGVSLWRLALPYFAVGAVASVLLFVLNEVCVPNSAEQAERILKRRLEKQDPSARNLVRNLGFTNTRDGRTWRIGTYNLETGEMLNVEINWVIPEGTRRWLYAARAIQTNSVWTFFSVREFQETAGPNSHPVPSLQTNLLAMPEFSETPDEIRSEVKISNRLSSNLRRARSADVPLSEIKDYLRFHPNPTRTDQSWLHTMYHGRIATPLRCLVVVLIALPFGAASGRRNVFAGVASSIFIAFTFIILSQLSLALGVGGWLPPWLAGWLPNLLFGLTGLLLTARVR